MRQPSLRLAILISLALHLSGLISVGWDSPADDVPPGEALRLDARVSAAPAAGSPQPAPQRPAPPKPRRKSKPAAEGVAQAMLPEQQAESEPASDPRSEPESVASAPLAEAPVAESEKSSPAGEAASSPAPDSVQLAAGEAASSQSAPESRPPVAVPIAQRLPRQGRVLYSGTAGGFLSLGATGLASWEHDGQRFQNRLSAGLTSRDSTLDYRSTGRFSEDQLISETTSDKRMNKFSTAVIDQAGGKVSMQRGADTRERTIKGLAVALSSLPQLLMTLDETLEKAAFFVVGDFWVEDSVLIARGAETLSLPAGRVETRHYQSRSYTGKVVDVWLAPVWRNAPVRIRIEADGVVVDLKASLVEIDGLELAREPEALPQE